MRALRYLTLTALLAGAAVQAAPGDWNVYMDASAINRVTVLGDMMWCGTRGGILMFDLGDLTFTHYLDGLELKSSDVTAVTIDGRGSIWAAMRVSGVARIDDPDGNFSVQEYSEALDGILSDSIMCLLRVDDDIYYGGTRGVAKFFNNVPAREPALTDSLADRTVYDMTYDPAGDLLWVACRDGIASYDRGTFDYVFYDIGEVLSVCMHQGEVYCVSDTAVLHLDGGSWSELGGGLHMDPVTVASGGGALYCITPERAYLWNGVNWWISQAVNQLKGLIREEYRISSSENILCALGVDGGGVPWVGGFYEEGFRGIYLAGSDGTEWSLFQPEGLTQNQIVALDPDPLGNIWVSTGQNGISFRSTSDRWMSYTKTRDDTGSDDALSYYVNNLALLYDSQDYLWCNSLDYDLDRIDIGDPLDKDDDIWAHFTTGSGTIVSNRFVRAGEDPGGNRWFMSDNARFESGMWGINIANRAGDAWLAVDPGSYNQMEGGNVFDCAFDDQGAYIAIRGYGVMYWRTGGFDWPTLTSTADDSWVTILGEDQLPSVELWSVEYGPDGSLWVGTSAGLVRYFQGTIDSFTVKTEDDEGLIGGTVYDIEFDDRGRLWVATNKGLNRIDPDGTISAAYTTAMEWQRELQLIYPPEVISPLPDHSCRVLAYDPSGGFIWIGTANGLARFDVNEPVEVVRPMSEMILYPNPVHAARGDNALRIARISGLVDIRVYNLEGGLVHEAARVSEDGIAWDLLTISGYQASSGIYIVQVKGTGGTSMRKVAVIR